MIIAICGGLGSGKTLWMTRYAYKEFMKDKRILLRYDELYMT